MWKIKGEKRDRRRDRPWTRNRGRNTGVLRFWEHSNRCDAGIGTEKKIRRKKWKIKITRAETRYFFVLEYVRRTYDTRKTCAFQSFSAHVCDAIARVTSSGHAGSWSRAHVTGTETKNKKNKNTKRRHVPNIRPMRSYTIITFSVPIIIGLAPLKNYRKIIKML